MMVPVAAVTGLLVAPAVSGASTGHPQANAHARAHTPAFKTLRHVTNKFHNIATAEQRGYGLLVDQDKIACIAMPGEGGMGVHWAKTKLVGDPAIKTRKPEALVYAPGSDGTLRLAAVEYVVLKADWDANHSSRPKLFGHKFNLTTSPNRFGLPDYYSLHVWAWKHNSAGAFSMWNPAVHCPS
jgi:hypothetical protein